MTVVDANLLIYAYDTGSPQHPAARRWLERAFSSPERIALPVQTIAAFLRITTHRRLPRSRRTLQQALGIVDSWLALPQVELLLPSDRHWPLLRQMLLEGEAAGDLVTDAQLAAAAMEIGAVVQTNDRDFSRFPGLRWKNPLVSS